MMIDENSISLIRSKHGFGFLGLVFSGTSLFTFFIILFLLQSFQINDFQVH